MTVDARYRVACSLGTILSPSGVSDNYVQDGYLVSTRGSLTLDGATAPARATEVLIAYEDRGLLVRFPRKLYVLSSHANPYTNRTTVEVGDRIALMEPKREAKAEARADEDPPEWFSTLAEEFQQMLAPTITAQQVLAKCCEAIGVTIASGSHELQSAFLVDRVDLSVGYVQVMRGLLESENCYGFIRPDGQLVVRKIDLAAGTGPVLTVANLESWEPVTGGNLPGDRVTVSYSALQVGQRDPAPDPPGTTPVPGSTYIGSYIVNDFARNNWTRDETISEPTVAIIGYRSRTGPQAYAAWGYTPTSVNVSTYSSLFGQDVVTYKESTTTSILAADNGKLCSSYLSNGISPNGGALSGKLGRTWSSYANDNGSPRVVEEITEEWMSEVTFAGGMNINEYVIGNQALILSTALLRTSKTITTYQWNSAANVTKTTVSRWLACGLTQEGQQKVEIEARDAATLQELTNIVANAKPLIFDGTEVRISIGRPPTQTRPSLQDLGRDLAADITGSDLAVISDHEIEVRFDYDNPSIDPLDDGLMAYSIRLPYAPDDYLVGQPKDATQLDVFLVYGGAENLARERAAVENALRFGHANGVSITTEARLMPTEPFAPIYLEAGGISAKFRVNGCSWAFENGTIAAGCDAMLVGVVGRTGGSLFQWVPAVGDINSSPSLGAPSTSGSPAPAYSATTPGGWNPSSPGGSLGALPTTGTDTYATSRNTTVALPPFVPIIPIAAGTGAGAAVSVLPYDNRSLTTAVAGGVVVGGALAVVSNTFVGGTIAGGSATPQDTFSAGAIAGADVVLPIEVGSSAGAYVPAKLWATYSQSSVYPGNTAATASTMQNDSVAETTATATDSNPVPSWLQMDFGAVVNFNRIVVGANYSGTLAGGFGIGNTRNRTIEMSDDGSSWTSIGSTGTTTDFNTGLGFSTVNVGARSARYVRINFGFGFLAATEFYAMNV